MGDSKGTAIGFLGGLGCLTVIVVGALIGLGMLGSGTTADQRPTAREARSTGTEDRPSPIEHEEAPAGVEQAAEPAGTSIVAPTVPEKYYQYAAMFIALGEPGPLFVGEDGEYGIGTLPGRYEVIQSDAGGAMLVDHETTYGTTDYGLMVFGVSSDGVVDGEVISFGDGLFWGEGVRKYTTVLGSVRSVYSVTAIDEGTLSQAVEYLLAVQAERDAKEVAAAVAAVEAAQAELDAFLEAHIEVREYLDIDKEIELFAQAEDNPKTARRLEELRARMRELEPPADDARDAFQRRRVELREQVVEARLALLKTRRE